MNFKELVATGIIAAAVLNPAAAFATVELEEGAIFFEDNSCKEADGTPGVSSGDGQCVTIEDYDYLHSYEYLDSVPSIINPDVSIAEEAGLDPNDDTLPSERILGDGVSEPHSFADMFAPTRGALVPAAAYYYPQADRIYPV